MILIKAIGTVAKTYDNKNTRSILRQAQQPKERGILARRISY